MLIGADWKKAKTKYKKETSIVMQFIKANPKSERKCFFIKKSPHALYSYAFAANNSQFYNDRVAPDEDDAAVRYLPVSLFFM